MVTKMTDVSNVYVGGQETNLLTTGCQKEDIKFKCNYSIRLDADNKDICGIMVVPGQCLAPELLGLSLEIGAQRCIYWDRAALESGHELLGQVLSKIPALLPISKSYYMRTDLLFHYDVDFIDAHSTWKSIS